jgi:CSLREA domain-containing protein
MTGKFLQVLIIPVLSMILPLGAASAATLTVTKTADTSDGVCNTDCSLREALAAANATASDDRIEFDAGVFATPQIIALSSGTELQINNDGALTINGPGFNLLTVKGTNASRVFSVNAGANAAISGLTISGSNFSGSGAGIANQGGTLSVSNSAISGNASGNLGGGIFNSGTLTVTNSTILGNLAGIGGGIYNQTGTVTLDHATVNFNSGGGVFNDSGNQLVLTNSTVNDNSGGGIRNLTGASLTISASTINNNSSTPFGGGIDNAGTAAIINSTVTANQATEGGGIFNHGTANLTNVTVNGNFAGFKGGGVRNTAAFSARNSIFADNSDSSAAPADFSGVLSSQGFNLIENTSGAVITGTTTGNITGIDPKLGPLFNNDGPTQTCALLPESPAIDAADPNNFPTADQRGTARPKDGDGNGTILPDIGAFERVFSGKPPLDFDGDGKTDISIFRPGGVSGAEWWYLSSADGGNAAFQFGVSTDKPVPADYTGDGRADIAFWRPSNGFWFIQRSEDRSFFSFPFGAAGDLPAPADYDGDGKTDAAVFRPSSGTWFISRTTAGILILQFGVSGDLPTPADYDGDHRADIAIFRPASGEWWINYSSTGQTAAFRFGTSTDRPVPGDWTGDGRADAAFWRPSNGFWFILRSEDFSFFSFPFGISSDFPAPGDYDGDAKLDAAVFRPSQTAWYLQRSSAGIAIIQFAEAGDIPLAAPPLP